MEATREIVKVTGKPLRWTLTAVRIASWLLWLSSFLLVGIACVLTFVATNLRGMWFIIIATMAALSGFGSILSCYGYTQLLTFRALIQRLNSGLDSVERVIDNHGGSLDELRRIRDGLSKEPQQEAKVDEIHV